jgi:hypothetical protein
MGWLLSAGSTMQPRHEHEGKGRRSSWLAHFHLDQLLRGGIIGLASSLGLVLNTAVYIPIPSLSVALFMTLGTAPIFGLSSILLQVVLEKRTTTRSQVQPLQHFWGTKWLSFARRAAIRNGLVIGLLLGLGVGLSTGLSFGLLLRPGSGLSAMLSGLSFAPIFGLSFGLSGGLLSILLAEKSAGISPTDELVWSWRTLRRSLFAKRHTNTTRGVVALIVLLFSLIAMPSGGPLLGLSFGLLVGLSYWLLGLFQGVSSAVIADHYRAVPNQGIRRSARHSLVLGLISAVIVWLSGNLSLGLLEGLLYWWMVLLSRLFRLPLGPLPPPNIFFRNILSYELSTQTILTGLSAGLLVGLLNGGLACLRQGVLRLLLWRAGSMPWNYPRFLDEAAERILLRKVGGGYIFVHRLLLEYFVATRESDV